MVLNLLIKPNQKLPLVQVNQLRYSPAGIVDSLPTGPLRHVLILSKTICDEFHLSPGDLRENIVINYELHSLPSGTLLQIGTAKIRLTFHCEPCARIKDKVNLKAIEHKRGYLGQFQNTGTINIGDQVTNLGVQHQPVAYKAKDRIQAFLTNLTESITTTELLFQCGLSLPYARAIPSIIKNMPQELREKVVFKSHSKSSGQLSLTI